MLTARSECHVSGEAAVIRNGNGTLHGEGVYHSFGDKAQRFEARKPTCSLQIISPRQGPREAFPLNHWLPAYGIVDWWCLVITRPFLFIQPLKLPAQTSKVQATNLFQSSWVSIKKSRQPRMHTSALAYARTRQSDGAMICLVVVFAPWLRSCEAHGNQRGLTSDPIVVMCDETRPPYFFFFSFFLSLAL